MLIEWLGHSCFRLTLKSGTKITFDPGDSTLGFKDKSIETDLVLVSHKHYDHFNLSCIKGDYDLVDQAVELQIKDVFIKGIKTYHDQYSGSARGESIAFKVEADGLTVCHLGDLGEKVTEELAHRIGHADIIMVPIGGHYTLDGKEAKQLMELMEPNIILPMHFKTNDCDITLDGLHLFLEAVEGVFDVSRIGKNYFEISSGNLKKRARIILLTR